MKNVKRPNKPVKKTIQPIDVTEGMVDKEASFEKLIQNTYNGNPLIFTHQPYMSINPADISSLIIQTKKILSAYSETFGDKLGNKQYNISLSMGNETFTETFMMGIISSILWLREYIRKSDETFGIEERDIKTTLNVFDSMKLPTMHDVFTNEKGELVTPTSPQGYMTMVKSIVQWLHDGCDISTNEQLSNMQVAKILTDVCMNRAPMMPFIVYNIGDVSSSDMFALHDYISKRINIANYLSNDFIYRNQPRFNIVECGTGVTSIINHPLSKIVLGERSNDGTTKWLGAFMQTEGFNQMCKDHDVDPNMINRYLVTNTIEMHRKNLKDEDRTAMFIENNSYAKRMLEMYTRINAIDNIPSNVNEPQNEVKS